MMHTLLRIVTLLTVVYGCYGGGQGDVHQIISFSCAGCGLKGEMSVEELRNCERNQTARPAAPVSLEFYKEGRLEWQNYYCYRRGT